MTRRLHTRLRKILLGFGLLVLLEAPGTLLGEPPPAAAITAFDTYTQALETRLARQHLTASSYLAPWPPAETPRLLHGDPVLELLSPPAATMPAGALLHHWRATAFVPAARAADFESLLRHLEAYPHVFAPQVLAAQTLSTQGDTLQASLRVRQRHVLTVVLDSTYAITFGRLDPQHGSSFSRSLHIAEVTPSGTPAQDHGFLWRQNTYWSWAERDGGLYLQLESVSLTRSVPTGLGWAVRPYVESIPRDSLEFTLHAAATALKQSHPTTSERTTR